MSYQLTPIYNLKYPLPDEEMNIPEDIRYLAETTETAMLTLFNNNVVSGATARMSTPDERAQYGDTYCAAVVTGGVLSLIYPSVVADQNKLDKAGGTITGNLTVNGTTTVQTPTQPNHAATKQYVDSTMPIGAIIMWGGSTSAIPNGWVLCDGSPHGSASLAAVLGSPNTQDLRDKFIVGSGPTHTQGTSGGSPTRTLSIANLPSHVHSTSDYTWTHKHEGATQQTAGMTRNQTHTHSITVNNANATHSHTGSSGTAGGFTQQGYVSDYIRLGNEITGNTYPYLSQTVNGKVPGANAGHTHPITINSGNAVHNHALTFGAHPNIDHEHKFSTVDVSNTHNHGNTGSTGSSTPLNIEPAWYALAYIVYKGA